MDKFESLYIIGESRTNVDNAITKLYGNFCIAFEVNPVNGVILDAECTRCLNLTNEFIKKILIGKSLETQCAMMEEEIARRYYGSSVRAIIASLREANKKYLAVKEKLNLM